jgi:hypothetical protein
LIDSFYRKYSFCVILVVLTLQYNTHPLESQTNMYYTNCKNVYINDSTSQNHRYHTDVSHYVQPCCVEFVRFQHFECRQHVESMTCFSIVVCACHPKFVVNTKWNLKLHTHLQILPPIEIEMCKLHIANWLFASPLWNEFLQKNGKIIFYKISFHFHHLLFSQQFRIVLRTQLHWYSVCMCNTCETNHD